MKTLRHILLLAIATMSILSCSKEKLPTVSDNEFAVKLSHADSKGHYGFSLELFKGVQFTAPLTLEVKMNGAKGDLRVNGQPYAAPMIISGNSIPIAYLPYSKGDHKITFTVTGGGLTQTAQLEIGGVTALSTNQIILPHGAKRFDPNLGENLFSANETSFKVFPTMWNGKTAAMLDWIAEGEGFVYCTINGVTTGAKVISAAFVELKGFIIEVNGVKCDNTVGIPEIEDKRTNIDAYNTIKIIGIIPENASNYDPIMHVAISYNSKYVISYKPLSEVKNKPFDFHAARTNIEGCDGAIYIYNEENVLLQTFSMWKWKK